MKISNREKSMLVVLLLVAIGAVYYSFAYTKQSAVLSELKAENDEVQQKYDEMQKSIADMEKNSASVAILQEKITAKSERLYPKIWQEKIILELNKLITESNITANISFTELTSATIESYFKSTGEENAAVSSLDDIADSINEKNNTKDVLESTKELGDKQKVERETVEAENGDTVQQMKVSIAFTGTYDNAMRFIKSVSQYERLIAMPNISIAASSDKEVSGSMDLEFYSVPKLSGMDEDYLEWALQNEYGKGNPFTGGSSAVSASGEENISTYNMIMVLKENISDLPSITMGISEADMNSSYIYDDSNEIYDAEIEVNEVDGRYYIKYKLGGKSYPSNYAKLGYELKEVNGQINIGIRSCARTSMDDKVAVNLKVTNSTSRKAMVTIMDDDSATPRVNIDTKGNVQYVNK